MIEVLLGNPYTRVYDINNYRCPFFSRTQCHRPLMCKFDGIGNQVAQDGSQHVKIRVNRKIVGYDVVQRDLLLFGQFFELIKDR